jgi:hypothetical protein
MAWPKFYPISEDCPPADAFAPDTTVYRFLEGGVPSATDFLSFKELGWADGCKACGLSVYTDIRQVEQLAKSSPTFKGKQFALAELKGGPGLLKHTPREPTTRTSHHTWWVPAGIDALPYFSMSK